MDHHHHKESLQKLGSWKTVEVEIASKFYLFCVSSSIMPFEVLTWWSFDDLPCRGPHATLLPAVALEVPACDGLSSIAPLLQICCDCIGVIHWWHIVLWAKSRGVNWWTIVDRGNLVTSLGVLWKEESVSWRLTTSIQVAMLNANLSHNCSIPTGYFYGV